MAKAKKVLSPYEALQNEVITCAEEFAAARANLAKVANNVAQNESRSQDFAPDLAAPTAFYTLAKDRYDAIRQLVEAAGKSDREDLTDFPPYVRVRAFFDAAYPPID